VIANVLSARSSCSYGEGWAGEGVAGGVYDSTLLQPSSAAIYTSPSTFRSR
jgi:hypothetical protein